MMNRDNLCSKVNDGDIIFYDGERVQIFKANKKTTIERLAVLSGATGVWSTNADEFEWQTNFERLNPGDKFTYRSNNLSGTFHGFVTMATRWAKTVRCCSAGASCRSTSTATSR